MKSVFWGLVASLLCGGCATPTATTELISQGLKGLEMARSAREQSHEIETKMYQQQLAALDAAFDSDVRLITAGGLKDKDGKAIALTADWIISSRKGYSAAACAITNHMVKAQQVYATDLDNIAAANEALQLANELVVMQWNVGERFKQQFLQLQQRSTKNE
jgi:hypothetical protein